MHGLKHYGIPAGILVFLLGIFGYFVYTDFSQAPMDDREVFEETTVNVGGIETGGEGRAIVEQISVGEEELSVPDLSRPYTAPARLPESVRRESEAKVATAIANLTSNPALWSSWMELAVYRKASDDFKGAEEIWLYVTQRWPLNPAAYANLGDLYMNHLAEYQDAETYLRRVVELEPEATATYRTLHDLYRLYYRTDTDLASEVLAEGVARNPQASDLMIGLALYYKEKGRIADARASFVQALALSKERGDDTLSAMIEEELAAL